MVRNSLLFILSTLVSLAFAELILVLRDDYPENQRGGFYNHWAHVPSTHFYRFKGHDTVVANCPEFKFKKPTNNLGFVDREVPERFENGTLVVFGDSFTEGAGAPFGQSWPHQLAKTLKDSACVVNEVYNFGVAGSDPYYNLKIFEHFVLHRNPNVVMLCINQSDIYEVGIRGNEARFLPDGSVKYKGPPRGYWLFKRSILFRLFCKKGLKMDDQMRTPDQVILDEQMAIKDLSRCIQTFKKLCYRNNIRFLLVAHPFPARHMASSIEHEGLKRLLDEVDVEKIDLFHGLTKAFALKGSDQFYWPLDGHYNRFGYGLMAKEIYDQCWPELCDTSRFVAEGGSQNPL